MKYEFTSKLEINKGLGVHLKEPLPVVAILPSGKRVALREDGLYLPPSFEDKKPSRSGYWDFGDDIKVRQSEDGVSSSGCIHYDYRGWIRVEVLAPAGTKFVFEDPKIDEQPQS